MTHSFLLMKSSEIESSIEKILKTEGQRVVENFMDKERQMNSGTNAISHEGYNLKQPEKENIGDWQLAKDQMLNVYSVKIQKLLMKICTKLSVSFFT